MKRTETWDAQRVIEEIRRHHLRANISGFEDHPEWGVIRWEDAWLDSGWMGALIYAKVPIDTTEAWGGVDHLVIRVYPTKRSERRILKYYWHGSTR